MTDDRALRMSIEQRLANKAAAENLSLDRVAAWPTVAAGSYTVLFGDGTRP